MARITHRDAQGRMFADEARATLEEALVEMQVDGELPWEPSAAVIAAQEIARLKAAGQLADWPPERL